MNDHQMGRDLDSAKRVFGEMSTAIYPELVKTMKWIPQCVKVVNRIRGGERT